MGFDWFDVIVLFLSIIGSIYFAIQYYITQKREHYIALFLSFSLLLVDVMPIVGIPIGQILGDVGLFWPLIGLIVGIGLLIIWFHLKGWR